MPRSSVDIVTFGCRLNARESDTMRDLAIAAGLDNLVIVNTCAVTAEAERQARQAIRRLRRERPEARIVVTGCAAQIDPTRYAALPETAHVVGNDDKLKAETWHSLSPMRAAAPPAPRAWGPADTPRTRAYLDVQQGCDHGCTFCIIPYGRGPSRSVPIAETIARVQALVAGGTREIVLTGVDLTAWGDDLPAAPRLGTLVEAILADVPALPRLRLSSLDPAEMDERLIALFAEEPRVMPHLHLSLQSGDDLILKRMKRRHSAAQALDLIARLRARRDIAVGADLIAGFPTEDEAMFERTRALVAEVLDLAHVFPYSPRPGTPAARMKQVDGAVIRARAAALREAAKTSAARFLARQIGDTARVLVERSGRRGHAENFADVALDRPAVPGTIVDAAIEGVADNGLRARILAPRIAA